MVEVEALSKDADLYALAVREISLSDRTTVPGLRFEVFLLYVIHLIPWMFSTVKIFNSIVFAT